MSSFRVLGALALLGALLALAACDDPTDVGSELIDERGVAPERVVLPLNVDTVDYAPVTGTASSDVIGISRFLAGQQEAGPPFRDVEATGYIDLARRNTPDAVEGRVPDAVELTFVASYVYGDTTQAPTFSLHDVTEEWEAAGVSADTTFGAGFAEDDAVTTFSALPGDTLTVALPQSWIFDHLSELQAADDTAFAEAFHGFQVRAAEGNGVVGFPSGAVEMTARYGAEADTVAALVAEFGMGKQLTTLRSGPRSPVEDRYVVQAGTGRGIGFDLSLGALLPDSLRDASVNSAQLIFEIASTFAPPPRGFVRPGLQQLDLHAIPLDENGEPTGESQRTGQQFVLGTDSAQFVNNFPLVNIVQSALVGEEPFRDLQLRAPQRTVQTRFGPLGVPDPSLNSVLICRSDEGDMCSGGPRLELLYTPTQAE